VRVRSTRPTPLCPPDPRPMQTAYPDEVSPDAAGRLPPAVMEVFRALLEDVDRLGRELAGRILDSQPGYAASAVERDALERAARDNITRGILRVVGELPPDDEAPDEARAIGALRAAQGVPLEDVLNAYRAGGQLVWEEMLAVHARRPDGDADALLQSAHLVWRESDLESNAVVQGYRAEEARLRRQDHQRQQATIDGLLVGRGADSAFAREAALTLDLPPDAPVVCVVVLPDGGAAAGLVESTELAAMPRTSWTTRAGTRVGLVAADPMLTDRLQQVLSRSAVGRVGVSPPVNGLADVPRGYRLAELAARRRHRRGPVAAGPPA
jgi:hypothetical protein